MLNRQCKCIRASEAQPLSGVAPTALPVEGVLNPNNCQWSEADKMEGFPAASCGESTSEEVYREDR